MAGLLSSINSPTILVATQWWRDVLNQSYNTRRTSCGRMAVCGPTVRTSQWWRHILDVFLRNSAIRPGK
jgi:hypothetical protein